MYLHSLKLYNPHFLPAPSLPRLLDSMKVSVAYLVAGQCVPELIENTGSGHDSTVGDHAQVAASIQQRMFQ